GARRVVRGAAPDLVTRGAARGAPRHGDGVAVAVRGPGHLGRGRRGARAARAGVRVAEGAGPAGAGRTHPVEIGRGGGGRRVVVGARAVGRDPLRGAAVVD